MSQTRLNTIEPAHTLRKPSRRKRLSWLITAPSLCLTFLLICAALTGALQPEESENAPEPARQAVYTQLIPDGKGIPVQLELTAGGESFTLVRTDTGYALQGEPGELNPHAARELLATGAAVISRQTLEGSASDFGFDAPAARAVYTYEDGSTLTLTLGDAVPTGSGWYAMAEGSESIHVVNNSLQHTLTLGKNALYALPDLSERFTANTLLEASIQVGQQEAVTIARVTEANPFNTKAELTTPIRYPANSERAAEIYLALEKLQPVSLLAAEGNDTDWGLDNPLAVIRLKDKVTTTLTLGQRDGTCTLRISGDKAVYEADSGALGFLQSVTVPYLAEQLPGLIALSEVSALTVTAGAEAFAFTMDLANTTYTLNGKALDSESFIGLYQQIIGLLIERWMDGGDISAVPRVQLAYTLKDGSAWTLTFAAYDDQFDLVIRDNCACFLISRSKVDTVVDAIRTLAGR